MQDINMFFQPRSIVIVGGGSWCSNIIRECRKINYAGKIWVVHPDKTDFEGLKVYNNISQLPHSPDAAFVGVNRVATIKVVEDLAKIGTKGAVVFASGFAEMNDETGASLNHELINAANGMMLLGPNCYGFINALDGVALWPDEHGMERLDNGVAIVTQSSNVGINLTMQQRGLPIAYMVAVGNQACLGISEIALQLVNDDRVNAIGIFMESIGDLRSLELLANTAAKLNKQIVVCKVGKTEKSKKSVASHTGAMVGSAEGASALFKRLGIVETSSVSDLLETLKFFNVGGTLAGNKIVSLSCSGGEASLMADAAKNTAITFPDFLQQQIEILENILGERVLLANPLDYHTYIWGNRAALVNLFSAFDPNEFDLICIVLDFPNSRLCDNQQWDLVVDAVIEAKQKTNNRFAIISTLVEGAPERSVKKLMQRGIVYLGGLSEAIGAIDSAIIAGRNNKTQPIFLPKAADKENTNDNVIHLNEFEAKQSLKEFGISIPRSHYASNLNEVEKLAGALNYPLVIKGQAEDTQFHKSEHGLVKLNLRNTEDLIAAAKLMPAESFIIEEMITGSIAEILVGIVFDKTVGYVLTLASGGTLTELLQDSCSLILPASEDEVRSAIQSLKVSKVLKGYRNQPAADIEALIDVIMKLQNFVISNDFIIQELEINPVICCPKGAYVADVILTMEKQ